ncbi:unnamed protein product [Trichobilharzia szidati]|nr:unnamed protein product [Trichobilharzia szidati]
MICYLLLTVLVISAADSAPTQANHSTRVDVLHNSSLQGGDKNSGPQYHRAVDKRWSNFWIFFVSPFWYIARKI